MERVVGRHVDDIWRFSTVEARVRSIPWSGQNATKI
jgi:hypothetical protein